MSFTDHLVFIAWSYDRLSKRKNRPGDGQQLKWFINRPGTISGCRPGATAVQRWHMPTRDGLGPDQKQHAGHPRAGSDYMTKKNRPGTVIDCRPGPQSSGNGPGRYWARTNAVNNRPMTAIG